MRLASTLLLAAALAAAACAASEDPASGDGDASTPAATSDDASLPAAGLDLEGEPPTELVVEQLAAPPDADAPTAESGDEVAVHYVGRAWSTGEVFDSSEGRSPITFTLGAGQVIAGWDVGIAGLQVGERARLIIPPDLAYGDAGAGGGAIAPGETLIFDVELVEIVE